MLLALLLAGLCGLAMQAVWGDWVDIPPEVIVLFHAINFLNLLQALSCMMLASWEGRARLPQLMRRYIADQHRYILRLTGLAVCTFCALAFYELFPYGFVAACALFPAIWYCTSIIRTLLS